MRSREGNGWGGVVAQGGINVAVAARNPGS